MFVIPRKEILLIIFLLTALPTTQMIKDHLEEYTQNIQPTLEPFMDFSASDEELKKVIEKDINIMSTESSESLANWFEDLAEFISEKLLKGPTLASEEIDNEIRDMVSNLMKQVETKNADAHDFDSIAQGILRLSKIDLLSQVKVAKENRVLKITFTSAFLRFKNQCIKFINNKTQELNAVAGDQKLYTEQKKLYDEYKKVYASSEEAFSVAKSEEQLVYNVIAENFVFLAYPAHSLETLIYSMIAQVETNFDTQSGELESTVNRINQLITVWFISLGVEKSGDTEQQLLKLAQVLMSDYRQSYEHAKNLGDINKKQFAEFFPQITNQILILVPNIESQVKIFNPNTLQKTTTVNIKPVITYSSLESKKDLTYDDVYKYFRSRMSNCKQGNFPENLKYFYDKEIKNSLGPNKFNLVPPFKTIDDLISIEILLNIPKNDITEKDRNELVNNFERLKSIPTEFDPWVFKAAAYLTDNNYINYSKEEDRITFELTLTKYIMFLSTSNLAELTDASFSKDFDTYLNADFEKKSEDDKNYTALIRIINAFKSHDPVFKLKLDNISEEIKKFLADKLGEEFTAGMSSLFENKVRNHLTAEYNDLVKKYNQSDAATQKELLIKINEIKAERSEKWTQQQVADKFVELLSQGYELEIQKQNLI